jgi:hypothetical protein
MKQKILYSWLVGNAPAFKIQCPAGYHQYVDEVLNYKEGELDYVLSFIFNPQKLNVFFLDQNRRNYRLYGI